MVAFLAKSKMVVGGQLPPGFDFFTFGYYRLGFALLTQTTKILEPPRANGLLV